MFLGSEWGKVIEFETTTYTEMVIGKQYFESLDDCNQGSAAIETIYVP